MYFVTMNARTAAKITVRTLMNILKGVIVFNTRSGFWLVHSVPKYPPALEDSDSYDYPHTG